MAIQIQIDDRVRFPVKGELFDADGRKHEFHFEMVMQRMDQDEFEREMLNPDSKTRALVERLALDWSGVKSGGEDVSFGAQALQHLLRMPSMCNLIWVAYCDHAGVRAKNSGRSSV